MAYVTNDVQLAQVFKTLWNYIKEHGQFQKPDHPQMGGIWSADTYELGGVKALMTDGGYGNVIIAPGRLNVFVAYTDGSTDNKLTFSLGGPADMRDIAEEVMRAIPAFADEVGVPADLLEAMQQFENSIDLERLMSENSGVDKETYDRAVTDRANAKAKLLKTIKQHIK